MCNLLGEPERMHFPSDFRDLQSSVETDGVGVFYHACPCSTSLVLLHWPARLWMIGRRDLCHLVEMISVTAFAVDVAAAVGAYDRLAWPLNQRLGCKSHPSCRRHHSEGSVVISWTEVRILVRS